MTCWIISYTNPSTLIVTPSLVHITLVGGEFCVRHSTLPRTLVAEILLRSLYLVLYTDGAPERKRMNDPDQQTICCNIYLVLRNRSQCLFQQYFLPYQAAHKCIFHNSLCSHGFCTAHKNSFAYQSRFVSEEQAHRLS